MAKGYLQNNSSEGVKKPCTCKVSHKKSKYPGVKVWLQEVSLGPDAKDHMPSSEYTGKGPDANGPVAKGLMTQGSANGQAAKCLNTKGPGCM
jgi:hypothetical protein